jgi:hypothetical protein
MRADFGGGLFTRVLRTVKPCGQVRTEWWWKVVVVMAKVIEFYVPDRMRERRLWNSLEQRGKVVEFTSVEGEYAVPAAAPMQAMAKKPS